MKTRFYLMFDDNARTRFYDTLEEASDNKEFIERYFGIHVRLKVDEQFSR